MDQCSAIFQASAANPPDRMSLFACSATTDCCQLLQPDQNLKCPRCDSNNTKFCYYNNYSYSQPRHFCKNCRRYWTKGGSLRNVPIGGGCRKNKRLKHIKMADPTSLASFDEATSNMLANMSRQGNWSSLLANVSGSWSSSFLELPNESQDFGCAVRLGQQPTAYDFTAASCSSDSSLPFSDTNVVSLGFSSPMGNPGPGVLLNRSDLDTFLNERHIQLTCQAPALDDELSPYSMTSESFDGETEVKLQQTQDKEQRIDHCLILPSFQDETKDYFWCMKGKSELSPSEWNGSLPILQGSYDHSTAENSHFWCINNAAALADLQPLATFAGENIL